jgi:uncharacterized protein
LAAPAALRRAERDPLVDALRALALLGVLVVNAVSYPAGPSGSPLGLPRPLDSSSALTMLGLVAWWMQGKAYPLLTFLFGYSLALALRRPSAAELSYRRRRLCRLLMLGVVHGALLYAGDILTLYALAGLLLLMGPTLSLRRWVARWRFFVALALSALAGGFVLALAPAVSGVELQLLSSYGDASSVLDFVGLNWRSYWGARPGMVVLFLPEVLLLMCTGYIAGRLRWLTHRRWQLARRTLLRRLLPVAVALNLIYAVLMAGAVANNSAWQWVWLSASPLVGWLLSAALGAAVAAAWAQFRSPLLLALAPLGRFTLSVYVGHSCVCAFLFSGAGLAWSPGSVGLVGGAMMLWSGCVVLAHWADRRGFHGPLEAWMMRA